MNIRAFAEVYRVCQSHSMIRILFCPIRVCSYNKSSSKATTHSSGQDLHLWNLIVHNHVHKSPQPVPLCSGVPRNFVRGEGGQQTQLRIEDRENGDLRAVAP